jgi:YVTN family beta-propeller protein
MNPTPRASPHLRPAWRLSAAAALLLLASCGGGGDDGAAGAQRAGARERAQAATTSLAVPIAVETDALLANLTIPADAPTRGMWSATQSWPMNGLHAGLLPDGKVITYGTPANTPGTQEGRTYDLWTPSQGFGAGSHLTTYLGTRLDSFCSTSVYLPDGRLMVTGGNAPRQSTLITAAGAITNDSAQLADDRWYATLLALPDGRSVMLGGIDPYTEGMVSNPDAAIANGQVSMTPEVYTQGTGWRSLTGARSRDAFGPDYLRASYPRAWVAPDGRVFGISAETMWSLDVNANAGAGAVQVHGKFKTPASTTAPVNVGATNTAVMFAPGRILQLGGNGYFNGDGYPASDMATVVDINGAAPALAETARMSFPRRYPNAVVLADGKVVVTGGTRLGNNGGADAVYAAEIWNPTTGTWTVGASAAQIRVYHSATLLLPNGTVLSTGGGAPGPVNNLNAELYYPPNLFRTINGVAQLAPRPVLTGISALAFAHGASVQVELADAATSVSKVVLLGNGLVTHSFNPGQRRIELAFTQSGDRLTASLPASANLAPPGYYQLVVLDAAGVPSRAVTVSVGQASGPAPTPALPRGQTLTLASVSVAGSSVGLDASSLAVVKPLGTADLAGGQYIARDGLADAACVSLESAAQPGRYLRHANYRLQLAANDGTDLFLNDATFCPEVGSAAGSVRLRAKNFPGYLVHARADGTLGIDVELATAAFQAESSFVATPVADAPATPGPVAAQPALTGSTVNWTPGLDAADLSFSWDFGDGSPVTAFSASSAASHAYTQPGVYGVTLTVRNGTGLTSSRTFMQAVYNAPTASAPRASSQLLLEPRNNASTRLWVVNPDNDSVSVFDTATRAKLAEVAVGAAPRAIARAPGDAVWVVNRDGASISILSTSTLAVTGTVTLPRASQPFGLVFSPDGSAAWVALEALGQVAKLNPSTAALVALAAAGPAPRHLAISGDSGRLLVSRFVTGALPGEGTATVATTLNGVPVGGEVRTINTATLAVAATTVLRHSDRTDTEISGSGIPNYLGAAAISPDGRYAWVPSKQDNVRRGTLRNGLNLDFQNTVRAISSRIDLGTLAEVPDDRLDHDNASLASAATHDPTGAYLFVALETSRQVEVVDAARGRLLFRIEAGLAPQGLALSADGRTLYVHNFMSRSVGVVDLTALMTQGQLTASTAVALATVGTEKLAATVLRGKQLFYDARDTRLARDAYMSCATCHSDGGHDGRVWDLSGMGEGLRNTINLRGRAGMGQGRLHWSGNFDEVQDFEGQIRALAGGTGLMGDTAFSTGTRSQPLGDAKAGQSADLDALAAYVASLATFDLSPYRNADGTLTAAASAGRTVFVNQCVACHGGAGFTDSSGGALRNVGTIKASSGARLGGALTGLDTPTLRDAWATEPYLHDGSAATVEAAVQAHTNLALSATDLTNVGAFVRQIGREEAGISVAPANGLKGEYFANVGLTSSAALVRYENVNFNWGNAAPATGLPADNFSVRWTGFIVAPSTGSYRIRTNSDDGVRVWVNGTQRINNWTDHAPTTNTSGSFSLTGGRRYSITVEYYERGGGAVMQLSWQRPGTQSYVAVPLTSLVPQ